MSEPPGEVEVKTRKKFCNSIIPRSSVTSKYSTQSRSPQVQQGRSQPPQACQLDLLVLTEKSLEPALRLEVVPANVTVGSCERFYLVHQESGLRVPWQFSRCEAEEILKVTALWDWTVDPRTREPACRYRLLWLLEGICNPKKVLGVAV